MAVDFLGKELHVGDRVLYTHTESGMLKRGIIHKANNTLSTIRKVEYDWEGTSNNWMLKPEGQYKWNYQTSCKNQNIIKL